MADDKKNSLGLEDDPDFEFDDVDSWDDAPADKHAASGKPVASKDSSDPFGVDAFGADDDIFGAPASGGSDPFGDDGQFQSQDQDDDPFEAPEPEDDDPFDFQEMPKPSEMGARGDAPGNPDDEFGDLGGFAEESNASADDPFAGGTSGGIQADSFEEDTPAYRQEDDPFAEADPDSPEDDPFAVGDHPSGQDSQTAAEAPRRKNFVFPLALAATVAGVAFIGYSFVLPSLFPSNEPPAVAAAPGQPVEPAFPSALPNQPGGIKLPEQPASAASEPQLPVVPSVTGLPDASAGPSGAPAPTVGEVASDLPLLPPMGGTETAGPVAAEPAPPLPLPGAPDAPQPSLDEIVGGDGRGGIEDLREREQPTVPQPDLAAFEQRLAAIEEKVGELAARFDRQAFTPTPEAAPQEPRPLGEMLPPLKPEIVESATLKGVSRGLAWISTPSGVVEVKVGDTVPGGGKVTGIREYEGSWIVVTTDGIVVQ